MSAEMPSVCAKTVSLTWKTVSLMKMATRRAIMMRTMLVKMVVSPIDVQPSAARMSRWA